LKSEGLFLRQIDNYSNNKANSAFNTV